MSDFKVLMMTWTVGVQSGCLVVSVPADSRAQAAEGNWPAGQGAHIVHGHSRTSQPVVYQLSQPPGTLFGARQPHKLSCCLGLGTSLECKRCLKSLKHSIMYIARGVRQQPVPACSSLRMSADLLDHCHGQRNTGMVRSTR